MSADKPQIAVSLSATARPKASYRRWPALAAVSYIDVFCLVAGVAVLWNVARGSSWGEKGVVVLAVCIPCSSSLWRWAGRRDLGRQPGSRQPGPARGPTSHEFVGIRAWV
jgi:hypothetical protein